MTLRFTINGEARTVEIAPDEFLAETIRKAGFPSVRTGCGEGSCGSCTVWLDGEPVLSCSMLSARVEGREVTTVEGVRKEAKAFASLLVAEGADQCGYCSPGFVMLSLAAKRQLGKNSSEEDLRSYLSGNLCRCTGYYGRLRAVRKYIDQEG